MTPGEAINILIAAAVCSTECLYCDKHCPFYRPKGVQACNEWNDETVKEAVETISALRAQQSRGELLRRPGGIYMDKEGIYIPPVQPNAPLTGWISVKERLPQNETPVLVTYIGMDKKIHSDGVAALLFGGLWYWWEGAAEDTECGVYVEITHWMPLPDPPEEDEK